MSTFVRKHIVLACLGGIYVGGFGLMVACQRTHTFESVTEHSGSLTDKKEASSPAGQRANHTRAVSEPTTLMTVPVSAYAARVFPQANETIVTTPTQLIRLRGETRETHGVEMGHLAAQLEDSIVFWRDGALRTVSLHDLTETVLIPLKEQPQHLLASGPRVAWLRRDPEGTYSIYTTSAGSVELLYSSSRSLFAPAFQGGNVYYVEESGGSWRIGRAPLDASGVTFGPEHSTRRPSMLAAGPDGIYFYDGPKRSVIRTSFTLRGEETVRKGAICSPLAVSSRVVCAQVGGLFDIARPGADPRLVARETGGPISGIAVRDDAAYWIADSGENQMTVKVAVLPDI